MWALNWQFQAFATQMKTKFQQTVSVTKQDSNQVLILKNKIFSFVRFDSDELYLCKNTTQLSHMATRFKQIVEQETSFLNPIPTGVFK